MASIEPGSRPFNSKNQSIWAEPWVSISGGSDSGGVQPCHALLSTM